jgi:glyoxylase-like metal-dependent hydrolase (beta-lactamase superfamily II)
VRLRKPTGPAAISHPAPGVVRIDVPLPIASPDRLNCYLLGDGPERLLVDAGMRGCEDALTGALQRLGVSVEQVLVTHGHIDHWGLAALFGTSVLAHEETRSQFEWGSGAEAGSAARDLGLPEGAEAVFSGFRDMVAGVPALDPVAEGDLVRGWRVIWTPGHAPGHVCLYRESDRVLIAGDHLLPGFTPNIQPHPGRDALGDYLDSLERIGAMDIALVLPAHGEPFEDARARAQELLAHHADRLQLLRGLLANGATDVRTLRSSLFRSLDSKVDRALADMETYAHLDHLRVRGHAEEIAEGRWAQAA